jgi:hypothetical protein
MKFCTFALNLPRKPVASEAARTGSSFADSRVFPTTAWVATVGVSVRRNGLRTAVFNAKDARASRKGPAPKPLVCSLSNATALAILASSIGNAAVVASSSAWHASASLIQARFSRSSVCSATTRR